MIPLGKAVKMIGNGRYSSLGFFSMALIGVEHAWIRGVVQFNEKKPIQPSEWSAKIKHKYGDDCTLSSDTAYGIAIRDLYQEMDSVRKTSKEEHAWIGGVVKDVTDEGKNKFQVKYNYCICYF